MIAKAVHHVTLCVPDLDAALGFYCDLLGLEPVERPDLGIGGAWLGLGDTQLHLIVPPPGIDVGGPPEKPTPIASHTAFSVDDYDAALSHLRAAGLDVITTSPKVGQMWVTDPAGNIIELTTAGRS